MKYSTSRAAGIIRAFSKAKHIAQPWVRNWVAYRPTAFCISPAVSGQSGTGPESAVLRLVSKRQAVAGLEVDARSRHFVRRLTTKGIGGQIGKIDRENRRLDRLAAHESVNGGVHFRRAHEEIMSGVDDGHLCDI